MSGRGRKPTSLVQFVYDYMDSEFERLCELGVKVTYQVLYDIALFSLNHQECPVLPSDIEPDSNKPYRDFITYNFVYHFRKYSSIARRKSAERTH